MGVDLSYVNQVEDYGGVYSDSFFEFCFKNIYRLCANTVRVRLWHTPTCLGFGNLNNGKLYYDLYGVEKTNCWCKRGWWLVLTFIIVIVGLIPGAQDFSVWAGLPLNILKDSVYNYSLQF